MLTPLKNYIIIEQFNLRNNFVDLLLNLSHHETSHELRLNVYKYCHFDGGRNLI